MATQINTIEAILRQLNAEGNGSWIVLPGLYSLNTVNINGASITFNSSEGVILKTFFNITTGEIRTYLAKFLDQEGRNIP